MARITYELKAYPLLYPATESSHLSILKMTLVHMLRSQSQSYLHFPCIAPVLMKVLRTTKSLKSKNRLWRRLTQLTLKSKMNLLEASG